MRPDTAPGIVHGTAPKPAPKTAPETAPENVPSAAPAPHPALPLALHPRLRTPAGLNQLLASTHGRRTKPLISIALAECLELTGYFGQDVGCKSVSASVSVWRAKSCTSTFGEGLGSHCPRAKSRTSTALPEYSELGRGKVWAATAPALRAEHPQHCQNIQSSGGGRFGQPLPPR